MGSRMSGRALSNGLQRGTIDRPKQEFKCTLRCSFPIMICEHAFTSGVLAAATETRIQKHKADAAPKMCRVTKRNSESRSTTLQCIKFHHIHFHGCDIPSKKKQRAAVQAQQLVVTNQPNVFLNTVYVHVICAPHAHEAFATPE
jgi:hypothetical protein